MVNSLNMKSPVRPASPDRKDRFVFHAAGPQRAKIVARFLLGACFASGWLLPASAQSPQHEKIIEGQYARLKNGQAIPGGTQTWILWRNPQGGYELEDHFQIADPAAQLLKAMPPRLLSPQLRKELDEETSQTELDISLSADRQPTRLQVKGTRLLDGHPVDIATCEVREKDTRCKGIEENAKLAAKEPHELFYSFPFPMSLSSLVFRGPKVIGESVNSRLAVLTLGKKGPSLDDAQGQLKFLGEESLQLGNKKFIVGKYFLEISPKGEAPLRLTVWSSPQGIVLAMEDENIPGEKMALVQYKKYSDF
jgi:hypothetical protein